MWAYKLLCCGYKFTGAILHIDFVGKSSAIKQLLICHPTIPDSVALQSLQNNDSVKALHDGYIKGTSNKDSALKTKLVKYLIKLEECQMS